jgi:DNA processing protein
MDDHRTLEPWMALQHLSQFSFSQIHELLNHFGTPQAFLAADELALSMLSVAQREEIRALQSQGEKHPVYQQVRQDIDSLLRYNIAVITLQSANYPNALRQIHRPPLLLYVKGNPAVLAEPQVAVVGARKSSNMARDLAFLWSAELAEYGLVITSGLALGIDGAAHAGALKVEGKTIAVLAHGLDQIYPQQHRALSEAITENGALVSEFPLFTAPKRDHFPRRNRIISGMSSGVLVVEAAIKSGSLITAKYALEQNRDVFAVPGSINNMMAKGCHQLIKDGAYLVESAEDILLAMGWQESRQKTLFASTSTNSLNKSDNPLLQLIPFDLIHHDELMQLSGKPMAQLGGELMQLEMSGHIEMVAGNYRRIR